MGLDQHAFITENTPDLVDIGQQFADEQTGNSTRTCIQLHYWRKHPNLHGWMEQLYLNRCKQASQVPQTFNCIAIRLYPHELVALKAVVEADVLPETEGFFFGKSMPEDKALDLEFIEKALEAIDDGMAVYYDSWW